ncbi:MAG: N-acetylmuramoyl-L-alanine amidase, partial [Oscillochloris sp.]|nr:N-acetylmuramoyl-L-alanine amidase [Oscillochloris sp.]
ALPIYHTADANSLVGSETSWADRVRAEWSFHTYTRGWGDIGYNYLIDPNGVIYEGRAGGDNAVGFHDTANYGSMGVSVLGTYSSLAPTQAAQNSLVELLAWKADQRQIDPLGSSYYYGCAYSSYCAPYNSGAVVVNIAGHRQVTPGHTTCPGDSFQSLLPTIRQRVQNRISETAVVQSMELVSVSYDRDTLAAGELLKATFTVRNSGHVTIETQAPQAGNFELSDSYVYDEDECFLGATGQSYPSYPKESNRFRVMLGTSDSSRMPVCNGDSGGYPWRWGLNGSLAPGETRQVVGYLRFREPGSVTLRAGAINEYVSYMARDVFAKTITVTGERMTPVVASYNAQLQPLAYVYRLSTIPDNLLARTQNAISILPGNLVGSFAWDGAITNWGAGGPLAGLDDNFIIMQARVFVAPVSGVYTFRTTSDDGSWLWVDGAAVVINSGLHASESIAGSISLTAGRHVLSFKYVERTGTAVAGYQVQFPGTSDFNPVAEGLGGSGVTIDSNLGGTFRKLGGITIAADDQGGSGINKLRVSFDGVVWADVPGSFFSLSNLSDGSYSLRYKAVDNQGNESALQTLSFQVDSTLQVHQIYLPFLVQS